VNRYAENTTVAAGASVSEIWSTLTNPPGEDQAQELPEEAGEPEDAKPINYLDGEISVYFVGKGIGGWPYMVFKRTAQKPLSPHRVKSKFLPDRETQAEAQADLDAYAKKHGLTEEPNGD
jgi:hypothetical protein